MVRVTAYVDGFNLYYGLKAASGRKHLWLDLESLATSLLRPDQQLEGVQYFTAAVRNDPTGLQRQSDYLHALTHHCPRLTVVNGRFQLKDRFCRTCNSHWNVYEEKETDVSIAVAMVEDAACDRYDVALLISGDSDLCPGVRAVKRMCPEKRIIVAFPPKRHSGDLARAVDGSFTIGDAKIRQAQLPATVTTSGGVAIPRPAYWA
ncbi:NYN domain-containing protein [Crossiella cryophila]|uniref:Uncharacterized LabA/DUF88 family protein n=1 Tax=Crossiella cryophila TaxID=43355 RepID=A0A7W7C724_9PSEU|nr:NYN domain-containing protein [Crossiella cryophila]MBB4674404.1 uncharacterized LabA/DUF88 family protein [Crossiella cryophila]